MTSFISAFSWLDADSAAIDQRSQQPGPPKTELDRWFPFIFLHSGCLLVLITGCSFTALTTCLALYCLRVFAITGFYHRYFSHRAFKTSRFSQLIFAIIGSSSAQKGPLWWAAHHRHHHAASDTQNDIHSPVARSFLWSHIGWITSSKNMPTDYDRVKDFAIYPELRFINRFDWLMPAVLLITLFFCGEYLQQSFPQLHTGGAQLVTWGFFISTTMLFHATSSINSLAHCFGYRRFNTKDNSRNNPILALITFGEGWHNNHHQFSHCARQGYVWWEIDITYYGLLILKALGIISELKPIPTLKDNIDSLSSANKHLSLVHNR